MFFPKLTQRIHTALPYSAAVYHNEKDWRRIIGRKRLFPGLQRDTCMKSQSFWQRRFRHKLPAGGGRIKAFNAVELVALIAASEDKDAIVNCHRSWTTAGNEHGRDGGALLSSRIETFHRLLIQATHNKQFAIEFCCSMTVPWDSHFRESCPLVCFGIETLCRALAFQASDCVEFLSNSSQGVVRALLLHVAHM